MAGPQIASAAGVSVHLAFDISHVLSTQIMQTWWNSSPFWDTGLYLPGSSNRLPDPNLNAAWVTAIQAQGWGLIPIWFGLQAPCNTDPLAPNKISSDPAVAQTQGAQEADNATTAAAAFGLGGTIIYKDIENYTPDGGQCSSAVRAFLTGWVSEMHAKGYQAGVYGNPSPAQMDFSQVSPSPDDAWITKTPATGHPSQITIWGLSPLNDGFCPNNQRIHQYQINTSLQFGGIANSVDSNIEAAVVVAGTGTKSPNFNFTTFRAGIPHGINNKNLQFDGLIVGNDSKGQGFQYDQSTKSVTSIPGYPGATSTGLSSINDASVIVGSWSPSQPGVSNGFQYSAGTYTTIDYTGTNYTTLGGINDAGTIVGTAAPIANQSQAIVYNGGNFSSLFYPGAAYTFGQGINGVGHVVGNYTNPDGTGHAFFWNGSFIPIACVNLPGSYGIDVWGINDNDQVAGGCQDVNLNFRGFLYDGKTGALTMFDYPGASTTHVYGINDNGQIVGSYSTSTGKSAGFLATTQ